MAVPKLQERTLGELSEIKVHYFLVRRGISGICRFSSFGTWVSTHSGQRGKEDAQYMKAMAMAKGVSEPWV